MSEPQANMPIIAEFVEATPQDSQSVVRRAPRPDVQPVNHARISMDLDAWLDVDRTMHELYSICEVALSQRDQSNTEVKRLMRSKLKSDLRSEQLGARLVEWKGYAKKIETLLHQAQMEILENQHEAQKMRMVAEEALTLGVFDGKRRARLAAHLTE